MLSTPGQRSSCHYSCYGDSRFFDYETPRGVKVLYFIVRGSDGVISGQLSMRAMCAGAMARGSIDKAMRWCAVNVKNASPFTSINEIRPDCHPLPLPLRPAGDKVAIDEESRLVIPLTVLGRPEGIDHVRCGQADTAQDYDGGRRCHLHNSRTHYLPGDLYALEGARVPAGIAFHLTLMRAIRTR